MICRSALNQSKIFLVDRTLRKGSRQRLFVSLRQGNQHKPAGVLVQPVDNAWAKPFHVTQLRDVV